jgi:hypothetical protein
VTHALEVALQAPREGARLLEEGTDAFPESEMLWGIRCGFASTFGDTDTVLLCSERLLTLENYGAEAWFRRGRALQDANRDVEATAAYRAAVLADPSHLDSWVNLGSVLDEGGEHDCAIEAHDRALALEPREAMAWFNKGNSMYALARLEDAIECYEKAADLELHGAVDMLRSALAFAGRCDEVHALEPRATRSQGAMREQSRTVEGRRLVARYFIGQHTRPELLDEAVAWLLDFTASRVDVPPGLRDGVRVQYLWPVVTLRQRGCDLVLCEPWTARNLQRLRGEVTFTAFNLVQLVAIHAVTGAEPKECPYPGTMSVQEGALGSPRLLMIRRLPESSDDSGWRLLCSSDERAAFDRVSLLQLLAARPELGKFITLPIGWSVRFEADASVQVRDGDGRPRMPP